MATVSKEKKSKTVIMDSLGPNILPRVATAREKNIWKMIFFPGQRKVREFCGWPVKFRKDLESQAKVK